MTTDTILELKTDSGEYVALVDNIDFQQDIDSLGRVLENRYVVEADEILCVD